MKMFTKNCFTLQARLTASNKVFDDPLQRLQGKRDYKKSIDSSCYRLPFLFDKFGAKKKDARFIHSLTLNFGENKRWI
jgi:hypothetical protein